MKLLSPFSSLTALLFFSFFTSSCLTVNVADLNPSEFDDNFSFESSIAPVFSSSTLTSSCTNAGCHTSDVPAGGLNLDITDGNAPTTAQELYDLINDGNYVNTTDPEASLILDLPLGNSGHIQAYSDLQDDENYTTLLSWIQNGAPFANGTQDTSGSSFSTEVVPLLQTCEAVCHGAAPLNGNPFMNASTYANASAYVNTTTPDQSDLLLYNSDASLVHTGGQSWAVGSTEYDTVLSWIEAGALDD